MKKSHFTITTPIYYVNAAPHLGTAYTTVAADCLSRYMKFNGYDVTFITGLDEHGQKIAEVAAKNNMSPQEWCDSLAPKFYETWDMLNIKYTNFVRTSSEEQAKSVQTIWQQLYDSGYLYKGKYEGWYCVHEETYYAQNELEKNEDGVYVCPECKRPVQEKSGEENWFFKLSDFGDKLLEFYETNPDFIRPETRRNEIISFVKQGLKDLSISRSTFDWGVPFTFDEGHVAYVWADALVSYLTGCGYPQSSEFDNKWPAQYHFVGKDITRFHCIIWPAILMAANLDLPKCVFGHGFLLTKGEKMSKSLGNALAPKDLVDIFGVDAYRYYFMKDVAFGSDGSISIERMCQVYNADLANTYGNLVSRVCNMTKKYFDSEIPSVDNIDNNNPLEDIAESMYEKYDKFMQNVQFSEALNCVMELAHAANLYVDEKEPWTIAKDESKRDELAIIIYNLLETIRICAIYMSPFCPSTSNDVLSRLGCETINEDSNILELSKWGLLKKGQRIEVGEPLFVRLDESQILN